MSFKKSFEKLHPQLVEAAMAPVKGNADVTDVWVLGVQGDRVSSSMAVYKVKGTLIPINEMPQAVAGFGDARPHMTAIQDTWSEMFHAAKGADEAPHQMVVHYQPATKEIDADFSHDPLPLKSDEPTSGYAQRWAEEFTG